MWLVDGYYQVYLQVLEVVLYQDDLTCSIVLGNYSIYFLLHYLVLPSILNEHNRPSYPSNSENPTT